MISCALSLKGLSSNCWVAHCLNFKFLPCLTLCSYFVFLCIKSFDFNISMSCLPLGPNSVPHMTVLTSHGPSRLFQVVRTHGGYGLYSKPFHHCQLYSNPVKTQCFPGDVTTRSSPYEKPHIRQWVCHLLLNRHFTDILTVHQPNIILGRKKLVADSWWTSPWFFEKNLVHTQTIVPSWLLLLASSSEEQRGGPKDN